jgi:putative restriction endonuclease
MPLSPFERIRLDKAAVDEGFGIRRADDGDWLAYESLGASAAIRLAAVPEGYVAAIGHHCVAADLATRWPLWDGKSPVALRPSPCGTRRRCTSWCRRCGG